MRSQTPVASGLSISESKRKVDRGRWVWPIGRGDWHRWGRQPIRRALAPDSPGPHFPPFPLTPGAAAAELGSPGAALPSPSSSPPTPAAGAGRPAGHGELGLRGPAGPGGGEFSVLRLRQQPADRADPPPKPLGRVLLRGPPAGQCPPPGPCDVVPTPLTRGPGTQLSPIRVRLIFTMGPPGPAHRALAALCLTPPERCHPSNGAPRPPWLPPCPPIISTSCSFCPGLAAPRPLA